MPNNFRLTGNAYVSKTGSAVNSGLTPESPKLTIQQGISVLSSGGTLIVGSGVYTEAWSLTSSLFIIGDGTVIVSGITNSTVSVVSTSGPITTVTNITFQDFSLTNQLRIYGWNGSTTRFNNCNFIRCLISSWSVINIHQTYLTKCIFINCNNTAIPTEIGGGGTPQYYYAQFCIFINSVLFRDTVSYNPGFVTLINSYIDSNSVVNLHSSITASTFNFNNIQGKIIMNTNGATSGVNSNGVAQSFAQHRIDYPTYNLYSISANPLFNDPQRLNFTLQSTSPHIKAASDYVSNIGGTEYAVYKSATSTELTSGATISGLTLRGNNSYTITSSPTPGTIETAPIFLQWPATKPLTKLEWAGVLEFNKSITAGTSGNNNVPDWDTYTTGAGASPDRLTVKMRFSTQQTQPTTSAQWDNGGYWTAGNYELFEVNSKPKVDSNGKGNGDPAYIETSGLGDIVPTWIQLNVKLIDTYNP